MCRVFFFFLLPFLQKTKTRNSTETLAGRQAGRRQDVDMISKDIKVRYIFQKKLLFF